MLNVLMNLHPLANKLLNTTYLTPSMSGRLGNNMFMIANAYAKALEENKQLVISATQLGHMGEFEHNIFRKLDLFINHPDDANSNGGEICSGYFQSESYFEKHSEAVKSLFSPTKEFIKKIENLYPFIHSSTITAISVRRGDYLNNSSYHPVVSKEYITEALNLIPKSDYYFIFSDDFIWCKQNIPVPNAVYIELLPHEQMWLMSLCNHFIISNSSFSWWGAYLSRCHNKIVIAPETWYGPKGPNSWNEIYCKGWTILPTYFQNGFIQPTYTKPRKKYKIILKTTNKNISRVDSCVNTWLKDLDYVCLTDKLLGKYPEISGSERDGYDSAEEKTVHMINLVKNTNLFDEYDWLVFIDDDAILNVKKWEYMLPYLDENAVYGLYMHGSYQPQPKLVYPSGGSGYFISPKSIKKSNLMTNKGWGVEDAAVGKWIQENNIPFLDYVYINNKKHFLMLNGWFPFIEEYHTMADVNNPEYPKRLLEKVDRQKKNRWLRKHLTHHYIRHAEFMEYINNVFKEWTPNDL